MILQNSSRSQAKRFDFLCLNEGEIYFQSFKCSEVKYYGLTTEGRLHFCSHTLIFVPEKTQYGIVKFPYNKFSEAGIRRRREREIEIHTDEFIELKKHNRNHPYIRHTKKACFVFSLQHTPRDRFLDQIRPVLRIWKELKNHIKISEKLKKLYVQQKRSFQFDITYIDDFREKKLFEANVLRIKPLMEIPGKLVMTNEKIYYQPFHNLGHPVRKIPLNSIVRVIMRRYLLRQIGVEIFLKSASLYFIFDSTGIREKFRKQLFKHTKINFSPLRQLREMTRKWQYGETSNFDYLLFLNFLADRSFNDLTQYPVFPWVIKDQSSSKLDLTNPRKAFRNLSKPIGALNPQRLKGLKERYQEMPHPKFLYGTHYSTPYMVLYYLVRAAPEYMLRLQNGRFDNPDRLFYSFQNTWESLMTSTGDVKELTPEFFQGTGSFLLNTDGLDLGTRGGGDKVHHVVLPRWARSPKEFIYMNRVALESEFVSQNLHHWIDLIFGYKQRGPKAEEADNVFHWLTYEGNIKLDEIKDPVERRSRIDQIREFGQTPKQLFEAAHPKRILLGKKVRKKTVTTSDKISFENIFTSIDINSPNIEDGSTNEHKKSQSLPSSLETLTPTVLSLGGRPGGQAGDGPFGKVKESGEEEGEIIPSSIDIDNTMKKSSADIIDPLSVFLRGYSIVNEAKIHRDAITSVQLSTKRENLVYTSSQDSTVLLFDVARKRRVRKINRFGDMALSRCIPLPGGEKSLIVSSWNNNLYFYSISYAKLMNVVCGHEDAISSICMNESGGKVRLASSSWDGQVKLWDVKKQKLGDVPVLEYDEHNSDEVQCVEFSSDGNLIFSGDKNGRVVVHDIRSNKPVYQSTIHDGPVTSVKYVQDNKFISTSEDRTIRVHKLQSGDISISESNGKIKCMCVVSNTGGEKKDLIITGNDKGVIECWDINNLGSRLYFMSSEEKAPITAMDCNYKSLVVANQSGRIMLFRK